MDRNRTRSPALYFAVLNEEQLILSLRRGEGGAFCNQPTSKNVTGTAESRGQQQTGKGVPRWQTHTADSTPGPPRVTSYSQGLVVGRTRPEAQELGGQPAEAPGAARTGQPTTPVARRRRAGRESAMVDGQSAEWGCFRTSASKFSVSATFATLSAELMQ